MTPEVSFRSFPKPTLCWHWVRARIENEALHGVRLTLVTETFDAHGHGEQGELISGSRSSGGLKRDSIYSLSQSNAMEVRKLDAKAALRDFVAGPRKDRMRCVRPTCVCME